MCGTGAPDVAREDSAGAGGVVLHAEVSVGAGVSIGAGGSVHKDAEMPQGEPAGEVA